VLGFDAKKGIPTPVLGRLGEQIAVKQNARSFELALINVKDVMEATR
jgi:hypothetical protein